ncbi:GILT-like protein 1 [Hyposmocoma kahamanoa]|uniref:GILT-like protein 1 n=1 Tax=Hyposmocoma kahamanoa TaxID=1477025 RepID=UPI000E6D725F|nr:GILT-like protein 1 [Hyposmocoma kahamanoa]
MNVLLLLLILSFASTIQCDIHTNRIEDTLSTEANDTNTLCKDHLQVPEKVRIDLYYESLCPYCKQFYVKELAPVVQKLMNYIELYTYPFGHAQMKKNDNKTTFECQHGPTECYGNGLHACAIQYLPKMSEYVPFNTCLMEKWSTDKDAEQCGQRLHLNAEPIRTCANSDEAINLVIYYAQETEKLKNMSYVPYTVINHKVMDPETDLIDSVCATFEKPPQECKK